MITIKTREDIQHLKNAGRILASVLKQIKKMVRPGVKIIELDIVAEKLIKEAGAESSFKNYQTSSSIPKYPTSICASLNNEVVHAPASERVLQLSDILGIDIGLKMTIGKKSYYVDMAQTVPVGRISKAAKKLIKITKQALFLGIEQIKPGRSIIEIGKAIQPFVEKQGFSVVRQLVGHGVGFAVHEEPKVPNYIDIRMADVIMKSGMVLAVEPMINAGCEDINTLNDGWTIVTEDGSLSAHFEHTVAVTDDGYEILTK